MGNRFGLLIGALATMLIACSPNSEPELVTTSIEVTNDSTQVFSGEVCSLSWVASVGRDVFIIDSISDVVPRPKSLVTTIDASPDPSILDSLYRDYETVEVEIRSVEGSRAGGVGEPPSEGDSITLVALPAWRLGTIKSGMVIMAARRLLDGESAWFPAAWFESIDGSIGEIERPCGNDIEADIDYLTQVTGRSRSVDTIIEAVITTNAPGGLLDLVYEEAAKQADEPVEIASPSLDDFLAVPVESREVRPGGVPWELSSDVRLVGILMVADADLGQQGFVIEAISELGVSYSAESSVSAITAMLIGANGRLEFVYYNENQDSEGRKSIGVTELDSKTDIFRVLLSAQEVEVETLSIDEAAAEMGVSAASFVELGKRTWGEYFPTVPYPE